MRRLSDTSPEAERVLTEVYRQMSPGQKWLRLGAMYQEARALHAAGVRLRDPAATPRDVVDDWIRMHFGVTLPSAPRRIVMDPEMFRDLRAVLDVLDRVGIPYALGGSMAAAVYGRGRQTNDADISVEPFRGKEQQLVEALGARYYVSPQAVAEANRTRSTFNVIDQSTGFKVDVFVRKDTAFEDTAWSRRRAVTLPEIPASPIVVHSPEDLLLFKLRWYRLGNEVSELQWRDVVGLLKTQATSLDNAYLDHWAEQLGVADLLARARQESAA